MPLPLNRLSSSPDIRSFLLLSLALLALSACSSGGGGSSGSGTAVVKITDAAFEDLTSLELTITRVDLITNGGTFQMVFPPSSSSSATLTVDLVRLGNEERVIAVDDIPADTYVALRLTYEDAEGDASGVAQTVTPDSGAVRLDFASPVAVRDGEPISILIDFDGRASVTSGGPASVLLEPTLFQVDESGRGTVTALNGEVVDVGSDRFTLAVDDADRAAGEDPVVLGRLDVIVRSSTDFVLDGSLLDGGDGLELLEDGDVVEVTGSFSATSIVADQVKVDRAGGANPIRVRGLITEAAAGFTLLVTRILNDEDGDLAGVDPGESIDFTTGSGTAFLRSVGSGSFDADDLFSGQAVEVVGSLTAPDTVGAASVELVATDITGEVMNIDLPGDGDVETDGDGVEDEDENTMVVAISEVDGVPVASFTTIGNTDDEALVDIATADLVLDDVAPVGIGLFEEGQQVKVTGNFDSEGNGTTTRSGFVAHRLSLDEAEELDGTVIEGTADAGTFSFLAFIDGSNVRVLLSESTRLAVRDATLDGRVFNFTRNDFLEVVNDADGDVVVRGVRDSGEVLASRVEIEVD